MATTYSIYDIIKRFLKKYNLSYTTITITTDLHNEPIGYINSLSYNIREHGSLYIVAGKVKLNKTKLQDVFSNLLFITSHSQKIPIQIEIDDGFNVINIKNVWVVRTGYSYHNNGCIIVENVEMQAEIIK